MIQKHNLYESSEPSFNDEIFATLFQNQNVRVESIRSWLSEPGKWYDQTEDEWVVLIEGEAKLQLGDEILLLTRGDSLFIPKHTLHRVLWTEKNTLWLGVFSF